MNMYYNIYCAWHSKFYIRQFANIVSYVWEKVWNSFAYFQPYDMFEAQLHAQVFFLHSYTMCVLYAQCVCSVNEYNGTLSIYFSDTTMKKFKFLFFSLLLIFYRRLASFICKYRKNRKKCKVHMSCLLTFFFFCVSPSTFYTHGLNAYP